MKKIKITLSEMIDYVAKHSSWLSSNERKFFESLNRFHSERKFLSHGQKNVLQTFFVKICQALRHQDGVSSTRRVSYQEHKNEEKN